MEENKYKVLITTSGIGSRLGELTNYTNKSLIRIGRKPSISYILEKYPDDIQIIITTGYYGSHVKQFIKLAYPNKKITFVDVDNYSELGSSLGYSLLKAKNLIDCPFIYHASDTIVFENIPSPDHNWIGYCDKDETSQYRTLEINGDLQIYEKGDISSNSIYIGLVGIKDYDIFWKNLEDIYNENPNDSNLSDCHSISKMFDLNWKLFNFESWLDVGNVSSLKKARNEISDKFSILDKNDESIFLFDDFVIKFFYNKLMCENRVKRGLSLSDMVPKILDSSENFYKYEYSKGELFSNVVDEISFGNFLNWSKKFLWIEKEKSEEFKNTCRLFYKNKTIDRINNFLLNNNISDESNIINGVKIPKISNLLDELSFDDLFTNQPYQFHGDYILDNIIIDNGSFKLIDWRQDFGGDLYNGDIYYDLAKLNHNLIFNHDLVNDGHYFLKKNNDEVRVDILRKDSLVNCGKVLHDFVTSNNFDLKKVKILTSIIWLNMASLHDFKIGNFLFYYGKYNLYKNIYNI